VDTLKVLMGVVHPQKPVIMRKVPMMDTQSNIPARGKKNGHPKKSTAPGKPLGISGILNAAVGRLWCSILPTPTKGGLPTSLMSIPIPEKVLSASEKILLRDFLESPTIRPWIISGLSNAVNCSYENGEALLDEDEEFLHFRLRQMIRSIDYKTRKESFDYTRQMIYKRKIDRANYLQRKANPC
jgi:hypothetical protein